MGCWNKTCGLSNLPIYAGTPVVMFVLTETPYVSRSETTSFWWPILLPIHSTYNDYGGGENSSEELATVLSQLGPHTARPRVGKHWYHGSPVTLTPELEASFFDQVHGQTLRVLDDFNRKRVLVDFVMFRKDIVEELTNRLLLRRLVIRKPSSEVAATSGYLEYTYSDLVSSIPIFVSRYVERCNLLTSDMDSSVRTIGCSRELIKLLADTEEETSLAVLSAYIRSAIHTHQFTKYFHLIELLTTYVLTEQTHKITPLITGIVLGTFLDEFMRNTRRLWQPGCYEGSQSEVGNEYRVFSQIVLQLVESDSTRYDMDDGESTDE
jgi:hypothetical protein